jgi:hypothetical protein
VPVINQISRVADNYKPLHGVLFGVERSKDLEVLYLYEKVR